MGKMLLPCLSSLLTCLIGTAAVYAKRKEELAAVNHLCTFYPACKYQLRFTALRYRLLGWPSKYVPVCDIMSVLIHPSDPSEFRRLTMLHRLIGSSNCYTCFVVFFWIDTMSVRRRPRKPESSDQGRCLLRPAILCP